MTANVRNRLILLGVPWGAVLAAAPTLVMARPYLFLYAVAGGLLLGPAFGTLVNRTVRTGGRA